VKDRSPAWALLGYVALTLVLTYPIALRPTELARDVGAGADAYIFVWNIWWLDHALLDLHTNPYVTDFIFYPDGTNLALHTFPLTGSLLGAVLSHLASGLDGLLVGYNLVVLVSFVLTGLGTFLLVRRLTGSPWAAFIAGIAFAFTHYRFSNTVRLHCLETGVLAFSAWALVGFVQEKRVRWGVLVGLTSAALFYASKEYFVQLLIGILLAFVYLSIRDPRGIWTRRLIAPKVIAAGVFILLSLPLLLALWGHGLGVSTRAASDATVFSADLLDFLVPNPRHPVFGSWSEVLERQMHGGVAGFGLAVPLVAVVLAVWAVVTGDRRRTWPWAGLGIVFYLLSLGPVVRLAGYETAIPSLQRGLTALVPWLEISRTPMRFVVPMELAVAVLAGFALAPTPAGSARRRAATAVVGALLVFETLSIPLSTTRVAVHPYYAALAARPAEGAVLELPPRDRVALLHQTVHGRKIPAVRRAYPRVPPWSLTFWESDGLRGFFDTLFRPGKTEGLTAEMRGSVLETHRRFLTAHGIRFVTVTKPEVPPAELENALSILEAMSPQHVYEDDALAAFEF